MALRRPRRRYGRRKGAPRVSRSWVRRYVTSQQDAKHFPVSNQLYASYNAAVSDISAVGVGTTDTTRIGDDLVLKSIRLKCQVFGADATNCIRIMVVQTRDRFTALVGGDVLRASISNNNTTQCPLAPIYFDGRSRFKVLYDRTFSTSLNGVNAHSFNINISQKQLARKHIKYYAGSGTDKEGGIYVLYMSDSSAVHPSFWFCGDLHFTG